MEGVHQAASLGKHGMGSRPVLFVTRLRGLRAINTFFFFLKAVNLPLAVLAVWETWKCFLKGRGVESTWLSPSSGRSALAMAVETLKRGSSGRLPAALGTAAKQGRCLLFCTLGLFMVVLWVFFPLSLLQPVAIWSEAGQLPAHSCWEECGGSASVPRHRHRCRDIHQIKPAACSEPVF